MCAFKTDGTEIERVLTKHETVEKELIANKTRLDKLTASGEDLLTRQVRSDETRELLERVRRKWDDLERQTARNGEKIAAAKLKADVTKSLNDVDARMKNLTKEVAQPLQINDLRSAKDALKKHQDLKSQVGDSNALRACTLESHRLIVVWFALAPRRIGSGGRSASSRTQAVGRTARLRQ